MAGSFAIDPDVARLPEGSIPVSHRERSLVLQLPSGAVLALVFSSALCTLTTISMEYKPSALNRPGADLELLDTQGMPGLERVEHAITTVDECAAPFAQSLGSAFPFKDGSRISSVIAHIDSRLVEQGRT